MNSFCKNWINQEIPKMPDGFTASQMHSRLSNLGKNLKYLENTTSIGVYLKRHKALTMNDSAGIRTYWRK